MPAPYQFGQPINYGGSAYTFGGYGPNMTTNWTGQNGSQFNLTRDQFNQYAPDYTSLYYPQQQTQEPVPPAPNSATANNPFLNLGLNAYNTAMQPFDPAYLNNVGNSLYNQANYNYQTNLRPTLDTNAIMAGGYGGDRAALAQGVVMDRLNQNVINAMAPQYAQSYENSLNRALQAGQSAAGTGMGLEQLDLNRMLGAGQLDLNRMLGAGQLDLSRTLGMGNLDLSRTLGMGNLGNQTNLANANIAQSAADLALREQLGLGTLGLNQQQVNNQTAQLAMNAAGIPTYTNPLAAGLGGAATLAMMWDYLFGNQGNE